MLKNSAKKMKNWNWESIIVAACFICFFIFMHFSDKKKLKEQQYTNKFAVIVAIGTEQAPDHSKFHKPVEYHKVLARDITDNTHFVEWPTTMEKYYNYKIGDTLHWKTILKSRWFYKYR